MGVSQGDPNGREERRDGKRDWKQIWCQAVGLVRTAPSMLGWPPHPRVSRRPMARRVSRLDIEGAAPASAMTQHSPARRAHLRCQQIKCRGLFADAPLCGSRGACESGSGSRPGGRKCEQPPTLRS